MVQFTRHEFGYCACGCGKKTTLFRRKPQRWVIGHQLRSSPINYLVDWQSECWIWQLGKDKNGYGMLHADGRRTRAARHFYEQAKGPIPAGLMVDHLCRTPPCVNPDHLEVVTNAENVRRGVRTHLTADDAAAIRADTDTSHAALARRYDVNPSTIARIRAGLRWAPEKAAA